MGRIDRLHITDFIVHVAHHKDNRFDPSNRVTPIGKPGEFPHDFFGKYILQALGEETRRLARFRDRETGKVAGAFGRLLAEPGTFVEASSTIARHLFEVMSDSKYKDLINAGDIMVAVFRDMSEGADEDGPPYLAVLKIDPLSAVTRRIREDEDGHRWIEFERSQEIPEPRADGIQKVAVISGRRQHEPEDHDLVILDNNLRHEKVARFFFDRFLESDLNRSPAETSRMVVEKTRRFVSRKSEIAKLNLTPEDVDAIVTRSEQRAKEGGQVTPRTLAKDVIVLPAREPEELAKARDAYVKMFESRPEDIHRIGADEEMVLQQKAAERSSENLSYYLDDNVRISGKTEAVRKLVKISPQRDAAGCVKITIKSKTLVIR